MSKVRLNTSARAPSGPWKFLHLDNLAKVRLGAGVTIGTLFIAMLLLPHV